jgi:hypothetical protein
VLGETASVLGGRRGHGDVAQRDAQRQHVDDRRQVRRGTGDHQLPYDVVMAELGNRLDEHRRHLDGEVRQIGLDALGDAPHDVLDADAHAGTVPDAKPLIWCFKGLGVCDSGTKRPIRTGMQAHGRAGFALSLFDM